MHFFYAFVACQFIDAVVGESFDEQYDSLVEILAGFLGVSLDIGNSLS